MNDELNTVIYTNNEQKNIVMLNGLRMVDRREGLKTDINQLYKKLLPEIKDSNNISFVNNNTSYIFYILNLKVTNLSQIDEFLKSDLDKKKYYLYNR